MNRLLSVLVNVATLKVGWLLAVLGAAQGIGWMGPLWALLIVGAYTASSDDRGGELALVAVACIVGTVVDTTVLRLGLIDFAAPGPIVGIAPPWIIGLWALLAAALTRSLGWLRGRPWAAATLGATLAPLSYWAGAALGAADLTADGALGLIAYGVAWAGALPLLVVAANHIGGRKLRREAHPSTYMRPRYQGAGPTQ